MKRGDKATAHKGTHEFSVGEDLLFIGMDYGADHTEAYVFMNNSGSIVNWLVDGDFSWVN